MSEKMEPKYGDLALLLYAAPFILNFVYALYVWSGVGLSAVMPQIVYLEVTQSPYIFLAGFAAVVLAVILDFDAEPANARKGATATLSKRLQLIALISVVLAFISAWYSAGGDLGTGVLNLVDGRYPLVFPAVLVLFSFLILPSVKLQGANTKNLLVILLLIASPAALYEVGKRDSIAGLGIGLALVLVAAYLLVNNKKD
ncbi:MAG: hypothetical protein OK442_05930 [Thaumarchaeota archaeon]|nr:hypothetical protein [Nitrososphaerota archaeon]